jgi:hypothetical protein
MEVDERHFTPSSTGNEKNQRSLLIAIGYRKCIINRLVSFHQNQLNLKKGFL